MRLKRFNESNLDEYIDIIKDAFYVVTDEFPLDIDQFDVSHRSVGYSVLIAINTTEEYTDLNIFKKQQNLISNISDKCLIAINRISNDLDFKKIYVIKNHSRTEIEVIFNRKKQLNDDKDIFTFYTGNDKEIHVDVHGDFLKKWFSDKNVLVKDFIIEDNLYLEVILSNTISVEKSKEIIKEIKKFTFNSGTGKISKNTGINIFNSVNVDGGPDSVESILIGIDYKKGFMFTDEVIFQGHGQYI